jgi:NADH:ubiquinone oxidoreductase subunit K
MTLEHYLILAALLFSIGIYGILTRRNLIGILLSVELMLNAANINFVAFARFTEGDSLAGPVFTIFIMAVSASEMAVALAILILMYRRHKNLDADALEELHG